MRACMRVSDFACMCEGGTLASGFFLCVCFLFVWGFFFFFGMCEPIRVCLCVLL